MAYQIKDDDVCSICLEELKNIEPNNIFIAPCGHAFCSECIQKENQFSNNCPNCREILNKEYHDRQQEIQLEERRQMAINIQNTIPSIIRLIENFISNNPNATSSEIIQLEQELIRRFHFISNYNFHIILDNIQFR